MKAGFARVDITPPLGTKLTGYFALRISDGVKDPIELNALALKQGEETAVIITGDFMYMTEAADTPIRLLIEKKCGVPADHIIMQAIHQHTSTTPFTPGITDSLYDEWLRRKYCDVVKMALDDLKEAKISVACKEAETPISFIRRYIDKNGNSVTNPKKPIDPNELSPIGEADNHVRLVKFTREGAKDIALVGFATHPDTVSGNQFSADWPGFARRFTERDLGVHCILVNGCQGDTNHHNPMKKPEKDLDKKYLHTEFMGRTIADAVTKLWNTTTPCEEGLLTCAVEQKLLRTRCDGIEKIDECKEIVRKFNETGEWPEGFIMADKAICRRISRLDTLSLFIKAPVSVIGFGNIVIAGYPGEAFTQYADILRETYPELFILSACNANASQGYFPTAEAFQSGGYEAQSTNFLPEMVEQLQGTAIKLIQNHKDAQQ